MTILELENLTGLDRATIRFYEKEGLINPSRKENSYRDYSEADAGEIMKIKLLRQLEVPIETIRNLQQGRADISSVLAVQASTLKDQISEKERAAAICKEISTAEITYQSLDATFYLNKMREAQTQQAQPAEAKQPEPNPSPTPQQEHRYVEYHPVRRFIARIVDYALLQGLVRFLLVVVLRIRPFGDFLSNVVTYGCLLASVPLQAWMLSAFGTTPGKWAMGIRVHSYEGERLSFADATQREWSALRYGYGFGIPFYSLWRMYKSYKVYTNREYLEQDYGIEHLYYRQKVSNKAVFALFCAIIVLISGITAFDIVKPKYLGNDLTVSQFAENYNYMATIIEYDYTMNSDGTWYIAPSPENGVVIQFGSKPEKENEPFRFETEGDRITRITYSNSWQEVFLLEPMSTKMICAIFTAVMSQKNVKLMQLIDLAKILDSHDGDAAVNIRFENIEINWTIQTENCSYTSAGYLADDEEKPSRLEFAFEIMIHE